ncbi:Protein NO VEIN, C-terminal [Dillenia turbinata]|uniref:Protein NO VEIN, C-terminal n=1 Tax=Dillenia turbinata TaxID=194707 RepID=A0AAN8VEU9_9MAGN
MHGQQQPRHRRVGGRGRGEPPQPPPQQFTPNFFQNPNIYFQNPSFIQALSPFIQNPNLLLQNLNSFVQNQNPNLLAQNCSILNQNPILPHPPPTPNQNHGFHQQQRPNPNRQQLIEKVDAAAGKARQELLAAGESVSSWQVSQSALLAVQADSWSSLGFPLQEVPSLRSLIAIEGKINAYIHCFVGVHRITSLHELDVAICKNEGVEQFEDLELGPLLRHPLVKHYFSVNSDAARVFKITTGEIISCLCEYVDKHKQKNIKPEDFLDFIAQKRSVVGRENLGVRIQSLGLHISLIREAKRSENATFQKYFSESKLKSENRMRKRPLLSSEKKQLGERFRAISERIKSFPSVNVDFCGKHIRFVSSSEDDESDDNECEDKDDIATSSLVLPTSDRVSSCPYPSATEERTRLGLKAETVSSPPSGRSCQKENNGPPKKKRKYEDQGSANLPSPDPAKQDGVEYLARKRENDGNDYCSVNGLDLSLTTDSVMTFIAQWKETCLEGNINKVFERMLLYYSIEGQKKKRMRSMFSLFPFVGLLNVAVTSIKCGMWDSMYDVLQAVDLQGASVFPSSKSVECETIDVEPSDKDVQSVAEHILEHGSGCFDGNESEGKDLLPPLELQSSKLLNILVLMSRGDFKGLSRPHAAIILEFVPPKKPLQAQPLLLIFRFDLLLRVLLDFSAEDIVRKMVSYFEFDHGIQTKENSLLEKVFIFLRRIQDCEVWLTEQFCIKDFQSLGYGEFFTFLEKNASLLPNAILKCFSNDVHEKYPLEVSLLQHQLSALLSQALNSSWEDEIISQQRISELLTIQFPLVCFLVKNNGCQEDLSSHLLEHNKISSNSVLFSAALLGTLTPAGSLISTRKDSLSSEEGKLDEYETQNATKIQSTTSKDAFEVLHRVPLMSDLNSWSHWDLIFAPSLGPLVKWLMTEANTNEILCLVTRDGKVIRVDPSVTIDSLLEAMLQVSSFQTALQLLSLLAKYGGKRHLPLSLLKSYARQAFETILKNCMDRSEVNKNVKFLTDGKSLDNCGMLSEGPAYGPKREALFNLQRTSNAVPIMSRFILDCLIYLPSEFRYFAAEILLSGLRSVVKDAPSSILSQCKQLEQRLMLHDIGLALGVMEWIDDYNSFYSSTTSDIFVSSKASYIRSESYGKIRTGPSDESVNFPSSDKEKITTGPTETRGLDEKSIEVCQFIDGVEVSNDKVNDVGEVDRLELQEVKDAALFIESIRREEFGLDPSLSSMETSMLKKQHARLGRALHCLSQELYSQDSHFLLELLGYGLGDFFIDTASYHVVQNADDNIYEDNVEPMLTFILREEGIVVLNNERGFSPENIKALCDVGNSTKRGSNAGYIGKKGIGFKSVFRVTDAPEIHSNGFHVKFDITEGQIGFVLPTSISPCDIDLFRKMVSRDADEMDGDCNTCIVLPFRSKLSKGTSMDSITNMFSDLHPSLLLFLHRLQCIKFRNMLDDKLVAMRKECLGNGIIKVSHGEEKMTWLVVSQNLRSEFIRQDVQTTEIALAFTIHECDARDYAQHLKQQPVFAFLPLRTYGLKFILQGDFVLPSSREEVDGDSPWNQWLLSKFPALFVTAKKAFCALPCFSESPGKAVTAYMSFVPLMGEVLGFFSSLPRLIISELKESDCLLCEGQNSNWVRPCKVLRGWDEQARILLPDGLLNEHLGLGFMDKDIFLPDILANALGVMEYGPKILLQFIKSLCYSKNGLKSVGLGWLSSWLNTFYMMLIRSTGKNLDSSMELDLLANLRKLPFIPLSNGCFASLDEGTIWLASDAQKKGLEDSLLLETFPSLSAKLRTVSSALLSASPLGSTENDVTVLDNITKMLHRIGIQPLSAHEIVMLHVLPAFSDARTTQKDVKLMTEYLSFVMFHLQSSCFSCHVERESILSVLRNEAVILTNFGYRRPVDVPIHFSMAYGNPIDVNKLINCLDLKWHEVDITYLRHPVTETLSGGLTKWRNFFQELGVTDFVQVVQVEKAAADLSHSLMEKNVWERVLIPPGSTVKDWESHELISLLSQLSSNRKHEGCRYLLEILDALWDGYFSDKVTGSVTSKEENNISFKSSLVRSICDFQWVASSVDHELHYPEELFYDIDSIRSILGATAPYAAPKVGSEKLLRHIGFKTQVTIDDALAVFDMWTRSETPFKASIDENAAKQKSFQGLKSIPTADLFLEQMSKFYAYIWREMATSRQKIIQKFTSGPFIFVPFVSGFKHAEVVPGKFLSSEEAFWQDFTHSVDQMKDALGPTSLSMTLCSFYPGLHDFFVNECGLHEFPSFRSYVQILLQLSIAALPSQVADIVFKVFLKWGAELKSGSVSHEDVDYLKESLLGLEFTILPTAQDKWVSLHPSFGLVCWCDDNNLRTEFKHSMNIDFLYFGELKQDEKVVLHADVAFVLQTLGIPALSEVVTREAIYYGQSDSSIKASLVDWALPYAQRYIYNVNHDKYAQLEQSEFINLKNLQVVGVEKLFCRNVIKRCGIQSKKRIDCNCLLQGNVLYVTQDSDSYSVFMELSRLLYDGKSELHLANFLHMIATMAETGTSREQIDHFISNSQKLLMLPDDEPTWCLLSGPQIIKHDDHLGTNSSSALNNKQIATISKRKQGTNSNWPPADWKTAPDVRFAQEHGFRTKPMADPVRSLHREVEDRTESAVLNTQHEFEVEVDADWVIEDDPTSTIMESVFPDTENVDFSIHACNENTAEKGVVSAPIDLLPISDVPKSGSSTFCKRDQLIFGTFNGKQAALVGRVGELVAFKYFSKKDVKTVWVNENAETGLPYDIVVGEGNSQEYIEVKATRSAKKDWFIISAREWQFAVEKGDSFCIAYVVLAANNNARVSVFRNPVKLCLQGKLQLVVMMPKQQTEFSIVS